MVSNVPSYVESVPGGGYRIVGSRIGLESVILGYLNGQSVEAIHESFPSLSLEAIQGAIAFYLQNRIEIDGYFSHLDQRFEELRQKSEKENAELLGRLRAARTKISPG